MYEPIEDTYFHVFPLYFIPGEDGHGQLNLAPIIAGVVIFIVTVVVVIVLLVIFLRK